MKGRMILGLALAVAVLAALFLAFGGISERPDTDPPHALDTTE